jgi:hypothetical protein
VVPKRKVGRAPRRTFSRALLGQRARRRLHHAGLGAGRASLAHSLGHRLVSSSTQDGHGADQGAQPDGGTADRVGGAGDGKGRVRFAHRFTWSSRPEPFVLEGAGHKEVDCWVRRAPVGAARAALGGTVARALRDHPGGSAQIMRL